MKHGKYSNKYNRCIEVSGYLKGRFEGRELETIFIKNERDENYVKELFKRIFESCLALYNKSGSYFDYIVVRCYDCKTGETLMIKTIGGDENAK